MWEETQKINPALYTVVKQITYFKTETKIINLSNAITVLNDQSSVMVPEKGNGTLRNYFYNLVIIVIFL